MRSICRLAAALFTTLAIVPAAQAWGPLGHSVVAELAQRHLSPAAEAEVEHLRALDHTKSLADIASWADEIRNDPKQQDLWNKTRPLHFIDFRSGDCIYTPPRDCKDGQCVVEAISHYIAILSDRSQTDQARLQALKFVVHFIGDIHQPLHGGYKDDLGGNKYQVQFQGQGTNLHRVWDSGLLSTRQLGWKAYVNRLDAQGAMQLPPPMAPYDNAAAQWAEESCRISHDIYPSGHVIDQAYINAKLPVAEARLREAGRRLAEVLNLALQNG
ncbi:S1/P1 Nuclease [Dyella sp. M7H15-1]|uniref:S1/P1 nuclease n=1 Tax=Dyella sp. M7H15-1 TaxID=2501295 RepID=UPI001004E4E3|nr:S1/P1 nuclease [Dyella sp. M7H15-1]QAU23665.1 S1/P1 Nuclease [Dyella sp. M7H15-1]